MPNLYDRARREPQTATPWSDGAAREAMKHWQRTGEQAWLERARAFAMHAIEQGHPHADA